MPSADGRSRRDAFDRGGSRVRRDYVWPLPFRWTSMPFTELIKCENPRDKLNGTDWGRKKNKKIIENEKLRRFIYIFNNTRAVVIYIYYRTLCQTLNYYTKVNEGVILLYRATEIEISIDVWTQNLSFKICYSTERVVLWINLSKLNTIINFHSKFQNHNPDYISLKTSSEYSIL